LLLNILSSFADFERSLISERTCSGLARVRANGRVGASLIRVCRLLESSFTSDMLNLRIFTFAFLSIHTGNRRSIHWAA
jgi:DNA invertase Pin-like site-specific DNA recombinase